MKKIKNWEDIQVSTGAHKRIPVGGYVVAITKVEDVPSKEYLRLEFDVCEGEQKLFFTNEFKADTRENKKWPMGGTMIRSYREKALPMLKGFTTAVENSNKGYEWNWDENTLLKKKVGVIIGEEEYVSQSNGKVYVRSYVAAVRSADVIRNGDFEIPELKKLDQSKVNAAAKASEEEEVGDPFAASGVNNDASNKVESDTPWDDDDPFHDN